MIRYRNGAYEVVVYVGRDPVTGKPRRVSRTSRMDERKRPPRSVLDAEAALRLSVSKGLHGTPHLTQVDDDARIDAVIEKVEALIARVQAELSDRGALRRVPPDDRPSAQVG